MNNKFDEAMKKYYSIRRKPSDDIKNALHGKLITVIERRETKLCWIAVIYAFLFSAAMAFALMIFTNNGLIVLFFMSNFLISLIINTMIILFCRNMKEKGGNEIATVHD